MWLELRMLLSLELHRLDMWLELRMLLSLELHRLALHRRLEPHRLLWLELHTLLWLEHMLVLPPWSKMASKLK
jgi:hypothetical protein